MPYTKTQKINAINAMAKKIVEDEIYNELDQLETDDILHNEVFMGEISHKGLDFILSAYESVSELEREDFIKK